MPTPPQPALGVVTPGTVTNLDGCPVLNRTNAYTVSMGVAATLEYTFRDENGAPIDLSSIFGSGGDSISAEDWDGTIRLRVKEAMARGRNPGINPIWEIFGYPHTPAAGIVRAPLSAAIVAQAGIYELGWGIEDNNKNLILAQRALLSVERSLFGTLTVVQAGLGPMTLGEIRAFLRDHATDNIRLDNVEFSNDEIMAAWTRPIDYWNETNPPIVTFTTRNFPFRENWRKATTAILYQIGAAWYRRNKQNITAGGIADDDLNRDGPYQQMGDALWKEYTEWVINKKVSINASSFYGSIGSPYSSDYGHR